MSNERKRLTEYYFEEPFFDTEKKIETNANFFKSLYQQCPVCGVRNSVITKAHLRIEHGMTKEEVEEKYGKIMNGKELYRKMQEEADLNENQAKNAV